MDDDFDDLIEDALDVQQPPEDELAPPEWGEVPPDPKSQQKKLESSSIVERSIGVHAGLHMAASQASEQPCGLHDLDAASQLMATVPNETALCTPAPLLAAQSQPGGHEVRTIDLAAELMAMETTGGQSQASNSLAPTGKRPREFTEPDELSNAAAEQPPKAVRQFRPLASHNAAMVPTPEFVKQERLAAQPKPTGPQDLRRPVRDNHVFRSLNAAQIGGARCVLIRGTSASDSVYCRMRPLGQPPKWWQPSQRATTGLLGESIHTLLHKIEDEDLNRTREALQSLREGGSPIPNGGANEQGGTQSAHQAALTRSSDAADAGGPLLWVARHAPRSYLQLLSEEAVNASVLRWLKSWDPVVFRTQEDKSKDPEAGMVRSLLAAAKGTDDRRPQIKGILLSGPPGVGKTTLAHVVARHCGYRVVEINASDERSRGALLGAINAAVQMQAVLGEKRPNCLVIDEIDGALGDGSSGGASGVRELANILKTGRIASTDKDTSGNTSGGKKGKGSTALMRPIICICNDLYTPALRPLREAAEVIEVMAPQPRMLQARLREVCNREHAAVQETALKALASKAAGDVRSCINTLQMLSARHDLVTGTHVSAVAVGDKDMTSAPFAVWDKLLSSRSTRPPDMLAHLMSFGEHDLIMRGVHENMLEVPYMDQDLARTAKMCDWMCDYDVFNSKIFRKQHFQLMPQLPVATLATASLCQTHSKMRLRWPKTGTAVTKRAKACRSAVADWLTTLPAPVATFSLTAAALYIAPALSAALSPPLESLDGLLLGKPKNPAAVQALVDLMLDYGVVYDLGSGQRPPGGEQPVNEGTPLKPALHALHAYSSSWMNPKTTLSDAVRSILLHKRQMYETTRQEEGAAEKAAELCQYMELNNNDEEAIEPMDSQMHEQSGHEPGNACAAHKVGSGDVAQPSANTKAGGGLRSFFKLPEKKKLDASKGSDGGGHAKVTTKGSKGHGDRQDTQSTQVRGAAGQAAAAIRGAKAPKALVNAKGNWLTTMGSKVMKEKQRRVLVAEGEELKLPEGVTASQATGKLHFAVTFKFNEGYTNAVKRPLRMYDVFPGMTAAQ